MIKIEFGRWQLRPDNTGANWMLALTKDWEKYGKHKGGNNKNSMRPPYQVRYFQWSNITNAFMYAASRDLMDRDDTMDAYEAAQELGALLMSHIYEAKRSMANYTDPAVKTARPSNDTPQTGKDGTNE